MFLCFHGCTTILNDKPFQMHNYNTHLQALTTMAGASLYYYVRDCLQNSDGHSCMGHSIHGSNVLINEGIINSRNLVVSTRVTVIPQFKQNALVLCRKKVNQTGAYVCLVRLGSNHHFQLPQNLDFLNYISIAPQVTVTCTTYLQMHAHTSKTSTILRNYDIKKLKLEYIILLNFHILHVN